MGPLTQRHWVVSLTDRAYNLKPGSIHDFCDLVEEKILMNVCLHGMVNEFYLYLETSIFLPFLHDDGGVEVNKWVCEKSFTSRVCEPI